MKKKLVSILMATMVCASAMTGCGSAAGRAPEDVETEAQIPAEILEAAEDYSTNDTTKDVVGTDKDYVFNPETLGVYNDEDVADAPNKSHQEIAEEEQLDINIVKMIEEQFDPVAVAADEYWTELLDTGREWKDLVHEMNQRIAAKAVVKLVDIDLINSTATYRVTTPDVTGFLSEKTKQSSSAKELADVINDALESDEIPVKERMITVPLEINGSEIRVSLDNPQVIDSITGGLYKTFKVS